LGIGLLTELVGKDNSFMRKGMYMMENGRWIEHADMGFINIKMELYTKGNGKMIYSMVTVMKSGLMEVLTSEVTMKAKKKD